MIHRNQQPRYPLLRIVTLSVTALAVMVALTNVAGAGSLLAWVVAAVTLTIFSASFYLKA